MDAGRVATGMEMLDNILNGGFRQGKSYLVSGEAGNGKTIFGIQFLQKGIELGETGLYITADEKTADIIDDARSFGFDLEEQIAQHKVVLLDYSDVEEQIDQHEVVRLDYSSHFDQLHEKRQEIDIGKIVADLNKYVQQIGAKRLVIDPIAPFIVKDDTTWEIRRYIRSLFYSLDSLGCTSVLTSAIPTGSNQLSQYGVEEFYASGIIVLQIQQVQKQRYKRILSVRKMRGSPYDLAPYIFDFEYGKGIVVAQKLSEDFF
jgi:circadian clock protein KaiC